VERKEKKEKKLKKMSDQEKSTWKERKGQKERI
jgi:hypothetical protein